MNEPRSKQNFDSDAAMAEAVANRTVGQLREEAEDLGAVVPDDLDAAQARSLLEERLRLVADLDRGALLDLADWANLDVDDDTENAHIVRRVVSLSLNRLDELSLRGVRALARLRNVDCPPGISREECIKRIRRPESFWDSVRRRRRKIMGSLIGRALESESNQTAGGDDGVRTHSAPDLKKRIQREGVVSGLATALRGAADDYVEQKLDEIERRIDVKLDQIDRRLEQWRDRELSNRLRILKITLIFSILVALVSLGYDYVRTESGIGPPPPQSVEHTTEK